MKPHRGLMFWALTPVLSVFVVLMPLRVQRHDSVAIGVLIAMESMGVLMLLGLYDPIRFAWAWRGLGGLVFLAFLCYVTAMLLQQKWQAPAHRGESNLFNAIAGLFAFGLPGLWWALFARIPLLLENPLHPSDYREVADDDLSEG